ncbi:DedA family protein [Flavobacterium agricola]|uniref:DedA family protein n=1 Tax=Flavobacterium agricola TaxID=2870839 RepID=A0ABY6LY49_9FLAO|nr:DedA family protein [Flavobacterium agricola]UYW01111.1 DedA family protein [Flavobacterium agricola]
MDLLVSLYDFIMHIDLHLVDFVNDYGVWLYAILFLIIFTETGVVVMPFLPGDSLLFAAGMLAAQPNEINVLLLMVILFAAAFLGDSLNYFIGNKFGYKATRVKLFGYQVIKQEQIDKTHDFYEKYGTKTIVIARFVPIVRTLAPFVAGIGSMKYSTFTTFNLLGAFIWVFGITLAGYFLGNIEIIRANFSKVVLAIIVLSVLPIVYELIKNKFFAPSK